MKHLIHYIVEYYLASGRGVNRGEVGGMTSVRSFSELGEAIQFANKYRCLYNQNPYNPDQPPVPKRGIGSDEISERELFHYTIPKIWKMNFRGDWRLIKERGTKGLKHIEGDIYEVKFEYFNLKARRMEYSCYTVKTLDEAVKQLKIEDSKTRLASDFTLYSKNLVTI